MKGSSFCYVSLSVLSIVLIILISPTDQANNPLCISRLENGKENNVTFVFVVDRSTPKEILPKLLYLLKQIGCAIPSSLEESDNLLISVMDLSNYPNNIRTNLASGQLPPALFNFTTKAEPRNSKFCNRFRRGMSEILQNDQLGNNVQFVVPIIASASDYANCSMIDVFIEEVRNSSRKLTDFGFNGILVNSQKLTDIEKDRESFFLEIKDISIIDTTKTSMISDMDPDYVQATGEINQKIFDFIEKAIGFRPEIYDLIDNSTTTEEPETSTEVMTTTSKKPTTSRIPSISTSEASTTQVLTTETSTKITTEDKTSSSTSAPTTPVIIAKSDEEPPTELKKSKDEEDVFKDHYWLFIIIFLLILIIIIVLLLFFCIFCYRKKEKQQVKSPKPKSNSKSKSKSTSLELKNDEKEPLMTPKLTNPMIIKEQEDFGFEEDNEEVDEWNKIKPGSAEVPIQPSPANFPINPSYEPIDVTERRKI